MPIENKANLKCVVFSFPQIDIPDHLAAGFKLDSDHLSGRNSAIKLLPGFFQRHWAVGLKLDDFRVGKILKEIQQVIFGKAAQY